MQCVELEPHKSITRNTRTSNFITCPLVSVHSPAAHLLAFPELVALGWKRRFRAWLRFFLVPRGRTLRIISRLADHDAISITRSRNKRCNTAILVLTTKAFYALGELDGQLLRTCICRTLGEKSQY